MLERNRKQEKFKLHLLIQDQVQLGQVPVDKFKIMRVQVIQGDDNNKQDNNKDKKYN